MLKFLKDVLFYSGGPFIGRIVTLFLLPLTTSYLTPSDYGIIGILTLIPAFANGLFSLGFHTSLGRVYSGGKNLIEKDGIIWTAFFALVLNNLVLTSLALLFAAPLSEALLGSRSFADLIVITFVGVGICTVRMAFEYYLRASHQAKKVFALNLLDVTASISSMIFMVVYLKRGAQGYMEAVAMAHAFNLAVMMLIVCPGLKISMQWNYAKELLKIGLPCIYGYLGYCLLQGVSRYALQMFSTEEEAGFYFLGSNIGRVIELPLWGFMSAWVPLFNSYLHRQKEALPVFSKMMTYYFFGIGSCVAALFCFARPVVHLFVQPPFYNVWTVVGLAAAAQALWGVYAITYPPLVFHKKTGIQSCLEIGAGVSAIVFNICLVPFFGKIGAALATLLGFLGLVLASLRINQTLLKVPYETQRLIKIIGGIACLALLSFLPIEQEIAYTGIMTTALIVFYFFCWFGVLQDEERKAIVDTVVNKLKFSQKAVSEKGVQ